ncbi:MAG: hypothetical protein HQ557_00735 [Bacteroidetes bacterium]|nr:hypothetical protein [Bacteroidota bacterium]
MHTKYRKYQQILIVLVFLIIIGNIDLFANDLPFVIGSVDLFIEGKTNKQLLLNELTISPYSDTFASEEDLKSYIEKIKQLLFNKRIFESVTSTIEFIETTSNYNVYKIAFDIIDAGTFLLLPFGKYDSNYGGKLGVKLYDKNLFGLLSDFYFDTSIRQLNVVDFDQYQFVSTFQLTNMPLFKQRFDISMNLIIDKLSDSLQNGIYRGSAQLYDIHLGDQSVDIFSSLSLTQISTTDITTWGNPDLNIGLKWKNIPLFDEKLNIYFNTNLQKSGISWENPNLTFTTNLSSTTLSIFGRGITAYIEHIYSHNFESNEVISHEINSGISTSFSLPAKINYTISGNVKTNHTNNIFDSVYITTENSLNHGTINWNDNFREGNSTNFSISTSMPVNKGISELMNQFSTYTLLQSTNFILLENFLNLSFRGVGFAATNTPRSFPVSPVHVIPGEYMRGILNINLPQQNGYAGLVLNTNFTFKFFDFTIHIFGKSPDGEFLISPFFDFSIFDSTPIADNSGPAWIRYSGGLEIYVIFDSFRSYPICATFGVDLEDIISLTQREIGLSKVEFEIILALSMFY